MNRGSSFWGVIKRFWKSRYGHIRFRLYDINLLVYLGIFGFLLILFRRNVVRWHVYVLIHVVLIIFILEVIRIGERHSSKKIFWLARSFYLFAVMLFIWEELEAIIPIFHGSYWATDMIIHWDKLIFRVHPTVWVQNFYKPWLAEFMNFFYSGYYLLFLVIPLTLFSRKKYKELFAVLSLVTFVYLSNFFLFTLFPTMSPAEIPMLESAHFDDNSGFLLTEINRLIQNHRSVSGATFPSSHVAGVLVWVLSGQRVEKKLGYVTMPIAVGIVFATVYLGLHHAIDPIFGVLWGLICYFMGVTILKNRGEDPLTVSNNGWKIPPSY